MKKKKNGTWCSIFHWQKSSQERKTARYCKTPMKSKMVSFGSHVWLFLLDFPQTEIACWNSEQFLASFTGKDVSTLGLLHGGCCDNTLLLCKACLHCLHALYHRPITGVREGMLLAGGGNCPENNNLLWKQTICTDALKLTFLVQSWWGLKPHINLFCTIEFVYNGFVCNVNSPMMLHFVRSRWHLLHAFQFAWNVNSAITFPMQSPRGAIIGKFCSYLAC